MPDETTERPKPKPRLAAKLAVAGSTVLIMLVLMELSVRMLGLAPELVRLNMKSEDSAFRLSENKVLGYEMKPNFQPKGETGDNQFVTNSHGQRDLERALQKTGKRIIILGDSVVQGIRTDLDGTISRQLEMLVAPEKAEVLNFGVTGYNTRSEAELLKTKGLGFKPDLVILLFIENDGTILFNGDIRKFTWERPALAETLYVKSHCFRITAYQMNWFNFRGGDQKGANQKAMGDDPVGTGLEMIAALSKECGFEVLVAIWPTFGDDDIYHQPWLFDGDSTSMRVEELAASHGFSTLRLRPDFVKDYEAAKGPGESPRNRYTGAKSFPGGDFMHPNALASKLSAQYLKQYLDTHPELLGE